MARPRNTPLLLYDSRAHLSQKTCIRDLAHEPYQDNFLYGTGIIYKNILRVSNSVVGLHRDVCRGVCTKEQSSTS